MLRHTASRIQLNFNCCCDKLIMAILSCLKSFHRGESKSILSATASICKISSSKMVNYYFSFRIKHGLLIVLITSLQFQVSVFDNSLYCFIERLRQAWSQSKSDKESSVAV